MIAPKTAIQLPPPDLACDLSIVIVSWNVKADVLACIQSIIDHAGGLRHEVILVDSASSDGTIDAVRARFGSQAGSQLELPDWLKLLPQTENVGYTRGNNIGFGAAHGRYILMLNPDTIITSDALPHMVDYLENHPRVGIIGPHTLNTDGTHQSTRRRFPTLASAIFESTWFQRIAPRSILQRYTVQDQPDSGTYYVDWVQGSALLTRRALLEQIGGLDEGYTMFSEELDWCKRAASADWYAVYMGDARIIHHGGKSTGQASLNKHLYFQISKIRYFEKFHTKFSALLLHMVLVSSYGFDYAEELLKLLLQHKSALRRERLKLYRHVLERLVTSLH